MRRVSSSARRDDENYWRQFEEEQRSDAKEIAAKPTGVKPFGALGAGPLATETMRRPRWQTCDLPTADDDACAKLRAIRVTSR